MAEYVCEVRTRCTEYGSLTDHERRERIVRCRDCRHARRGEPLRCTRFFGIGDCLDVPVLAKVEPDGFCAWGREREG